MDVQVDERFPAELRPPLSHREALLEADRCLACGAAYAAAPCTLACPARVDVPGFIESLADEDHLRSRRDDLQGEPPRRDVRARLPG